MCITSQTSVILQCQIILKCIRDTNAEEREREFELTHQPSSPKNDEI